MTSIAYRLTALIAALVMATSSVIAQTNLALNKPAVATSQQSGFPKEKAFDGNEDETGSSRWGSDYSGTTPDSAAIYVDLQGTATITQIYLHWETAYASSFKLEVSNDAQTWQGIYKNTAVNLPSAPRTMTINVSATGRYVRLHGLKRKTQYGYSLWEFQVFGSVANRTVAPLPVTLTSFSAAPQGSGIGVQWATASEQQNAGFEVQRSANGTDFATLAWVAGGGTTQSLHTYRYFDAAPLNTTSYYRLQQLDLDGTTTYSPVVAVQSSMESALATLNIYPNPTVDRATVAWQSTTAGAGRWYLSSPSGQVVHTEALTAELGANVLALDLQSYAPGSYVLTVEAAGRIVAHTRLQKTN